MFSSSQISDFREVLILGSGTMAGRVRDTLMRSFGIQARLVELNDDRASGILPYSLLAPSDFEESLVIIGIHNEFVDEGTLISQLSELRATTLSFMGFVKLASEVEADFSNYMVTTDAATRGKVREGLESIRTNFSDSRSLEVFDAYSTYVSGLEEARVTIDHIPTDPGGLMPIQDRDWTFVEAGAFEGGHLSSIAPPPPVHWTRAAS